MVANASRKPLNGFPNPFRTFSNFVYPKNIKDVFIWADWLWERNAIYRQAITRVISYFISDVTVTQDAEDNAVDTDAVNSFKNLLVDDYNILPFVLNAGEELAAMGNMFVSAERIFARELMCPEEGCGWAMRIDKLHKGVEYDWSGDKFTGECPGCHKKVTYTVKDVKSQTPDGRRIRFVFRAAEDMRLQYNRLTGTYKYLYKVPSDILDGIRRGDPAYLEDSPQVFMEAAAKGRPLVEFPKDMFFAMRTDTLSSLDRLYKGWGMPLFMVAFDLVIQLQHLYKFNEAVIYDYLVPTRIISPQPQNLKAGIDDPNRMPMSGAAWAAYMSQAIRGRISNPTQWFISPVPVQEQQIGGNKDIVPVDLLEYTTGRLLDAMGTPQEFRTTTIQQVAPSMGLRMFERQWIHVAKGLGKLVRWMGDIVARAHQIEDMTVALDMTSFVEDDMNKQVKLGLMQSNLIAKGPVLRSLGIDYEDDIKMQIKEQQMQADAAREQQANQENEEMTESVLPPAAAPGIGQAQMNIEMMQQQAQGGAAPAAPEGPAGPMPPVAPAGPGGPMQPMPFNQGASGSASIEQMYQEAQQMAQQLYNAPPNIRRQQLVQLKSTNPTMHAQVTQMLQDMSQQVASEAVAQSKMPQG